MKGVVVNIWSRLAIRTLKGCDESSEQQMNFKRKETYKAVILPGRRWASRALIPYAVYVLAASFARCSVVEQIVNRGTRRAPWSTCASVNHCARIAVKKWVWWRVLVYGALHVRTVATSPQLQSSFTGGLDLCIVERNGYLCRQKIVSSYLRLLRRKAVHTLIMICDELWPPSGASKLPGSPAASQFEHMSTESQIAQWNRAPTMSIKQLYHMLVQPVRSLSLMWVNLLCTFYPLMREGYSSFVSVQQINSIEIQCEHWSPRLSSCIKLV